MKKLLYKILVNLLGHGGGFPVILTSKDKIHSLLNKLSPRTFDTELIRMGPKGDGDIWCRMILKALRRVFPLV